MIKVHLNSGALCKFKKGKVTFGKEHLYITYGNIIYQKELKNVYKGNRKRLYNLQVICVEKIRW